MFKFYLINSLNFNVPKIYIFYFKLIKNAICYNKKKSDQKKINAFHSAFFLYKALSKPSVT